MSRDDEFDRLAADPVRNAMRTVIVYHAGCWDGFCAAWVLRWKYPNAEFHAAHYGTEPPDVTGARVVIADFSYKRDVLRGMCQQALHVTLLDHHLTAQAELLPVIEELKDVDPVPLSDGTFAYVDKGDAELVAGYSWSRAKNGGAIAYAGGGRANAKMVYMHRLILSAPADTLVDHRNRVTTDNRRINLRLATRQQNAANMDRGSEWKGVTPRTGGWVAQITVDGVNEYLGLYPSAEMAARAYDAAARSRFGAFARCNFGDHNEPFPANCTVVFDMTKSGGRLAWEWINRDGANGDATDSAPWLVDYTEDRDLWRHALPFSREINAALRSYPLDFDGWDAMARRDPVEWLVPEGRAILRHEAQVVDQHVRHAREIELGGHKVLAVNATVLFSDIAGKLAEDRPFGACYFDRADGLRQWSLRSRDGGVDVSEVAVRLGGGGHRNAAGFEERLPTATVSGGGR